MGERGADDDKNARPLHVDIYCSALNLVPKLLPEKLLLATPENCNMNGSFLGRLLGRWWVGWVGCSGGR